MPYSAQQAVEVLNLKIQPEHYSLVQVAGVLMHCAGRSRTYPLPLVR